MERKVVVICCVVGFLALLSAATGFAAEATRIKVNESTIYAYGFCLYFLARSFFDVFIQVCRFVAFSSSS